MSLDISLLKQAIIKCYSDAFCTQEIEKEGSVYRITLGPKEGFNGTDGEQTTQYVYLKNCGDTNATETVIKEIGDNKNLFKISVGSVIFAESVAEIGQISPSQVVPVKLSAFVPAGTTAIDSYINFIITYSTIPPYNETYFKEYKGEDELRLKSKTVILGGGVHEDYTIANIESFVSSPAFGTSMRTPVKVYHGAKDEILWDSDASEYKVRLKCPNCGTWSPWYILNSFDYSSEIVCSSCSKSIKVANNIDISAASQNVEALSKYKISVKKEDWTYDSISGLYCIVGHDISGAAPLGAYRKRATSNGSEFVKTYVDVKSLGNSLIIESKDSFEGFILLLHDIYLTDDHNTKMGMLYGNNSLYGNHLYGQEMLLHITDTLEVDIPIKGQDTVTIDADFSVLTKYTGEEASIEDIQSFYTTRYMMLGCYDGPALPLKLSQVEK